MNAKYANRRASMLAGCVAALVCSGVWLCSGLALLMIQGAAA